MGADTGSMSVNSMSVKALAVQIVALCPRAGLVRMRAGPGGVG
jgi:hypothetical protein